MFRAQLGIVVFILFIGAVRVVHKVKAQQKEIGRGTVTIFFTPGHPASTFIPSQALGAGVDGHEAGEVIRMLAPANVKAMLSAGLKPLSYRLRTELAGEAWHWNPQGKWSDQRHHQGYWISESRPGKPITLCYGYRLPRRGNTIDQANDDGYSRLDDGDNDSFWKNNPYLDRHFTGENNAERPEWVVIDLGWSQKINTMRLLWGAPYATRYMVEYWDGPEKIDPGDNNQGDWRRFANGTVSAGAGGDVWLRLSDDPIAARFVRVVMTASSGAAPSNSRDIRDGLGYAIREVYLGVRHETGRFTDVIRHSRNHDTQTVIYVSSTDPWHRAIDRDRRIEQPGYDLIFRSGLTQGLPLLVAAPLLYDTPENAVAMMRYLIERGYPITRVELGEEPDGQLCAPEHYAALYIQWARAIRQVAPKLQIGGPSFQNIDVDYSAWPERPEGGAWLKRLLDYLQAHGGLGYFQFCSFEWYPFDDICAASATPLAQAPDLLMKALKRLQASGLLQGTPLLMTEYGYSAFGGRPEVGIEGALFNADTVGLFLTLGGATAYLYGYEPNELINELGCSWGNNMLFGIDKAGRIGYRVATYYGARLLAKQWVGDSNRPHDVYPAESDIRDEEGRALVTVYAVHRPDGQWALLLINKDPQRAWSVNVQFQDALTKVTTPWRGQSDLYQFSAAQYKWKDDKDFGRPIRSDQPKHTRLDYSSEFTIHLPPYSLSVARGRGK